MYPIMLAFVSNISIVEHFINIYDVLQLTKVKNGQINA